MSTEDDDAFPEDLDPATLTTKVANGQPPAPRRRIRLGKKILRTPANQAQSERMAALSAGSPPMPGDIPAPNTPEAGKTTTETGAGLFGDGTKEAIHVWPALIEQERAKGIPPEAMVISVKRTPAGPVRAIVENLTPIPGDLVMGIEGQKGAGEDLYEYIVYNYHLPFNAPAKYSLQFFYRMGSGKVPGGTAELSLGHPDQVRKQIDSQAEYQRFRMSAGVGSTPRMPLPLRIPMPGMPAVAAPQTVATGISPDLHAQFVEFARVDERYKVLLAQIEKANSMPAPVPPAPPPLSRAEALRIAGISAEEDEDLKTKRLAKAVAIALASMGITPAGIGPQAAPLPPPPPPPQPKTLVEQARDIFKAFTDIKSLGEELNAVVGPGENKPAEADPKAMKLVGLPGDKIGDDMKAMFGEKLEDESWPQYVVRLAANNPHHTKKIMAWAGEKLDPESLMALMKRFQPQQLAAPAQIPASVPASPGTGWSPKID